MLNKMKFTKSFFLIAISSILILFSGCSDPDCSSQDTTYTKYTYDEESGQCLGKEIQKDVCGNGVIEDGETYCNCEKDVPKVHPIYGCDGELGEYLEKSCQKDKCILTQNEKVIEQTKTIEFKNSDLTIEGKFLINNPLILNTNDKNGIQTTLSLFKTSSTYDIKNIIVKELKIENSKNIEFGYEQYNKPLAKIGDKLETRKISIADTAEYETKETLKVKIVVSYTKETVNSDGETIKSEEKIETLSGSLGYIPLINPNFYEE